MKTWQTDNKDWMKQRREKWKSIQIRINQLLHINSKEKRSIKKYFLTGEDEQEFPISKMEVGPLLEMWLHPDQSDEHWRKIRDKYLGDARTSWRYDTSQVEFKDMAYRLINPEDNKLGSEESFFDGLEERLFYFFQLNELAEGRRYELTDEQYRKEAQDKISLARDFSNYLRNPNPNPYLIYRWQVPLWYEAMLLACDGDFLGLEWLIIEICKVLNNPNENHKLVVEMAEEINVVLKDAHLKDGAKQRINELLEQYGCKG